jgi:hypothetical protein
MYTRETKDIAKAGYMKGTHFTDIARDIGCNSETVGKWAKEEGWAEERLKLYTESTALAAREASTPISDQIVQKMDAYQEMLTKGIRALPETTVKSASEASQLIDKAIKGIETMRQDTLQLRFIEDIATVLKSEIPDIGLRYRIAEGLRKVHERYRHNTPE